MVDIYLFVYLYKYLYTMSSFKKSKLIHIDPILWAQLKSALEKSGKSMNQEIIDRLSSTFSQNDAV